MPELGLGTTVRKRVLLIQITMRNIKVTQHLRNDKNFLTEKEFCALFVNTNIVTLQITYVCAYVLRYLNTEILNVFLHIIKQ